MFLKKRNNERIPSLRLIRGFNLLQGLKFHYAHIYTHLPTYTQTHTYAIKVRHSKLGFFRFTHKGNKVCLCHFPRQTSMRVCLAPGLRIKLAHTEPPCISAFYYDHPHALLDTERLAVQDVTRGEQNLFVSPSCKHTQMCKSQSKRSLNTNEQHTFKLSTDSETGSWYLHSASICLCMHARGCLQHRLFQCQCTVVAG